MRISSKERQRLESSKTEQRDVYLCTLQRAFKISINLIKEFSCFFSGVAFTKYSSTFLSEDEVKKIIIQCAPHEQTT